MDEVEHFVDFGRGGVSTVQVSGWSFPEDGFIWSLGATAVMILPPRPQGVSTRLMIAAAPFTHPGLHRQRVRVSANGQAVGELEVADEGVFQVEVPAGVTLDEQPVTIILQLPDAVSPTAAGAGKDDRALALAVKWVRWGSARQDGERSAGGSGRKTIILARHHQTAPLAAIVNRLPVLEDRYTVVTCYPALERVRDAILGVSEDDLVGIWLQRLSDGVSPETVRTLAPGTPVITFPFVSMDILWPFSGYDARLAPEPPLYPEGRYPYSDGIAAAMAAGVDTASDDALLASYMARTAECMPDVSATLGAYAKEMKTRDMDCDVKLAGFILGSFQTSRLFHNNQTPAGPLLAQLATQLVVMSEFFDEALLGQMLLEMDRLLGGYGGRWADQVPVHPAVSAAFHLRWHSSTLLYRWRENEWSFQDYIVNYIRWSPWTI